MHVDGINVHVRSIEPDEPKLSQSYSSALGNTRILHIGEIAFTLSSAWGAESARKQAAALTALSNAAIEAAHWLEDMAGDIENAAVAS